MAISRVSNLDRSVIYDRYLAYVIDNDGCPMGTVLVHGAMPHRNEDTPEHMVFTHLPSWMKDPKWDGQKWVEYDNSKELQVLANWLWRGLLILALILLSLGHGHTQNANLSSIGGTKQSGDNVIDTTNHAVKVNVVAGGAAGGTSSSFGAAFPASGTAIGASDGANMQNLVVDASKFLKVNCAVGCSGSSFADNSVFTAGTTALSIAAGWYSTSPTNCTSGNACAPQLTQDRKLFVQAFQGTSPWVENATLQTQTDTTMIGGVNVKEINGIAPLMGNGTTGTGSQRVTIASDNTAFTVNAAQSGTWNNRIQDGSGNGLTSNSATYTAKFGLDGNLLGTLGTAFSTAGKVDVKAADGDVFVRQTAGSNLHTAVDSLPALATGSNTIGAVKVTDGTNTYLVDPCQYGTKTYKPISLASTTATKLIALATSKVVYVCEINLISAAANNVAIITGTKTTNECDTSTAGVFGGTTAATGWNFPANGGIALGNGQGSVGAGGTSLDLCILASASSQVSGNVVTVTQ